MSIDTFHTLQNEYTNLNIETRNLSIRRQLLMFESIFFYFQYIYKQFKA